MADWTPARRPPKLSAEETEALSKDFDCGPPCVIGTMKTEDELTKRLDQIFQMYFRKNVNIRKRTRRDIWRYVLLLEVICERARLREDWTELKNTAKTLTELALSVNQFRQLPKLAPEEPKPEKPKAAAKEEAAPAPEPPAPTPTPDDGLPQGDVSLLSDEELEKLRAGYGDILELAGGKPS